MRSAVLYLLQEDQTRCWPHCSGTKCRVSGRAHHLLQGSGCGVHLLFVQDRVFWLWCQFALSQRSPICSLSRSQMVLADSPISMATWSLPPTSRGGCGVHLFLVRESQVALADSPILMVTLSSLPIVIATYSKALATQSICSLFEIADGACGQSDLVCAYTMYAKAAEAALQHVNARPRLHCRDWQSDQDLSSVCLF